MLRLENISKTLGRFSLKRVSLEVREGEFFVLLGFSGAGKTILLEVIAGLLPPDEGRIFLKDRDITRERIQKRPLGLVPQERALFPHLTVAQNIAYGLRARGFAQQVIRRRAADISEETGIGHLLNRRPETLSGGEAQRVALARILVTNPDCLLLDEPLSSLDVHSRRELHSLLRRIHRQGQTILQVTHDYEEAVSLATRIGVLENGGISQMDTPEEIFRHPKSEFVARFIGIKNFLKGNLNVRGPAGNEARLFHINDLKMTVLTDEEGGPGFIMIRSEDITLSSAPVPTSARNAFEGIIKDIFPARKGIEVIVDIGVDLAGLITRESLEQMGLECGKKVWVIFKAAAGKFLRE